MKKKSFSFEYEEFSDSSLLPVADGKLLAKARSACDTSYSPYSHFKVGAAALLADGSVFMASNQENAAYPVSICAERTLLSVINTQSKEKIIAIAISYVPSSGISDHPIAPCGMCRQALSEQVDRQNQDIRIILGGFTGNCFVIESITNLLPLQFSKKELK